MWLFGDRVKDHLGFLSTRSGSFGVVVYQLLLYEAHVDALACLASSVLANLCSYCKPMEKQGILVAFTHDITQRHGMSPCI